MSMAELAAKAAEGVSTALHDAITGGALGGPLLAIVVSLVDTDGTAREIWHGHVADLPVDQWPEDSYGIARAKTALSVRTGMTAEQVFKERPDLLLPGDVEWWGNTLILVDGLRVVVSASGLDEQWDQRICEAFAGLLAVAGAGAHDG